MHTGMLAIYIRLTKILGCSCHSLRLRGRPKYSTGSFRNLRCKQLWSFPWFDSQNIFVQIAKSILPYIKNIFCHIRNVSEG